MTVHNSREVQIPSRHAERLARIRERVEGSFPSTRELALLIIEIGDFLLTTIQDVQASIDSLANAVTAESAELTTLAGELTQATAQITALQEQLSAAGTVSGDELGALNDRVKAIADAATAAVQSAAAPADPVAPDPAGPAPDAIAVADTEQLEATVYTFNGDPSTIDSSAWLASGYVTSPLQRPLYFFGGDAAKGENNGDGLGDGAWVRYVGAIQPVA